MHTSLASFCSAGEVSWARVSLEISGFWWEHTLSVKLYSQPRGPRLTDSPKWAFKWFILARAWTSTQLLFYSLSQSQLVSTHFQAGRKRGKALPQWHFGPTLIGKGPLKSCAQEGTHSCQTQTRCFLPHWQYCSQPVMSVLGSQRKRYFYGSLTWNLWRWAELEVPCCISNLLASNRGWQAYYSLLSLLHWRRLSFPTSCEFPAPGSWKGASSWWLPVASANFLLQIEARKYTTACCLFIPEGGSLSQHPVNFLSQAPWKALLRVPFLRAVIPEPELLGSSSGLKRKGTATSTHPLPPFVL